MKILFTSVKPYLHFHHKDIRNFLIPNGKSALGLIFILSGLTAVANPASPVLPRPEAPAKAIVKPEKPITGDKRGLIILVDFPDCPFSIENPLTWLDSIANGRNYSQGNYRGSVADYFNAQSRGLLNLTFDVAGPVRMPKNLPYYGEKTAIRPDAHAGEMIANACLGVADKVNLADYDWNGDKEIEMVFVVYAGYGEHVSNNTNYIWPKQGTLSLSDYGKPLTIGDYTIDTFACSCELNGTSGVVPSGIGAICHEFSHCFGLPDLYDKYGIGFGFGSWSLMDTGMYNGDGYCPAGFTAYERWYSGWMELKELKEPTSVRGMKSLADGGEAYIIYNDGEPNEYFILENRQKTGWDEALEGHGLLITHIDYDKSEWRFNSVNSDDRHPRYFVVPADGVRDSETCSTDAYPSSGNTQLTDTSKPKASLYNANSQGSKLLGKPITNIKENPDGTIDFDFMGGTQGGICIAEADFFGSICDIFTPSGILLKRACSPSDLQEFRGAGIVILRNVEGKTRKVKL